MRDTTGRRPIAQILAATLILCAAAPAPAAPPAPPKNLRFAGSPPPPPPPPPGPVAFPLKLSADKRTLVDQNNAPFPILARTAWFLTSLSAADQKTFLDDSVARGYNTVEFHVVNHDPRGNHPPFDGSNNLPFLKQLNGSAYTGNLATDPDFSTPNEPYWVEVDRLVADCESRGILLLMFPAYMGYPAVSHATGQGWDLEMRANQNKGGARLQTYGAWIANRYAARGNIVWMMGGDQGIFPQPQEDMERELLTGLKSVPPLRFISAEWNSDMIGTDQDVFGDEITLNNTYHWLGEVAQVGIRAYNHTPVMPAYLQEGPFDEEGPDGNDVNPNATQPVRRFQWWAWLTTIGGTVSGNGFIWPFNSVWKSHLDSQGSRDVARLNAFIRSISWWQLVPSNLDGTKKIVTAGGGSLTGPDYVAAAATRAGTLMVAYVPPGHTGAFTVDMSVMSAAARARWFDPTNGTYTDIGTGLANSGGRAFTTPGNNSAGQKDWVLVLDVP